jgi:type II secretory pathway component PulC
MYRELKKSGIFNEYQITLTAGTLLNVLSAILQENDRAVINRSLLLEQDFPELKEKNTTSLRTYLRQIRDALANKIDGDNGFFTCEKEEGVIVKVALRTDRDTPATEFSVTQFENIVDSLEKAIKNDPAYRDDYEAEEKSFKTKIKRSVK